MKSSMLADPMGPWRDALTRPENGFQRAGHRQPAVARLGLRLDKLVARMTIDQRAAIVIFDELGFGAEALLHRHVAERAGTRHDLVLLSHDLEQVAARNDLLGFDDRAGKSLRAMTLNLDTPMQTNPKYASSAAATSHCCSSTTRR